MSICLWVAVPAFQLPSLDGALLVSTEIYAQQHNTKLHVLHRFLCHTCNAQSPPLEVCLVGVGLDRAMPLEGLLAASGRITPPSDNADDRYLSQPHQLMERRVVGWELVELPTVGSPTRHSEMAK